MKVVLDTNVYISAMVFPGGVCDQVIRLLRGGDFGVCVSPDILTEIRKVLMEKFHLTEDEVLDAVDRVLAFAKIVYPRFRIDKIKNPAADNRILECAAEAKADFLVTGDKKHILPLKKFESTRIVSPSQFLELAGNWGDN